MKAAYPIILTNDGGSYIVFVPDFNINTQGADLAEAIEMARDAVGLTGIDLEDDGKALPEPSDIKKIKPRAEADIVSLVDVDFLEYRRRHDLKTVKKNCTVPSWLAYEAEKANINFSKALQSALKEELNITSE